MSAIAEKKSIAQQAKTLDSYNEIKFLSHCGGSSTWTKALRHLLFLRLCLAACSSGDKERRSHVRREEASVFEHLVDPFSYLVPSKGQKIIKQIHLMKDTE